MEGFLSKCFLINCDKSCYLGYVFFFIGIIIMILNLFAFLKMTRYYGKMNFENTILFLSFIQSVVLLIQMISSFNILICVFFFIQILIMCLLNNKFRKISRGFITFKYEKVTKAIIAINIIYVIIYIIICILGYSLDLIYLSLFYYLLEIVTSFFLAYHCCVFLSLIKQDKSNENKNTTSDVRQNTQNFLGINLIGDGLFYLIKKKQLSLLYLGNIICSFIEFIIDICKNLKPDYFYYFYFTFFFICFIHNSNIFISFYFIIREQYSSKKEKYSYNNDIHNENIIDDKFIEEEATHIEGENKRISFYLNEDKKDNRKLSNESNEYDKNKRKLSDNEKEEVKRKPSRTSTFGDNDDLVGPNTINIEDIPSNENLLKNN